MQKSKDVNQQLKTIEIFHDDFIVDNNIIKDIRKKYDENNLIRKLSVSMKHKPEDENHQLQNDEVFHGDDFIVENNIIKGVERKYDENNKNVGQIIFDTLSNKPHHVALIDALTGESTTFMDMKQRSIRLAIWMKNEGVTPGDVVALCSPHHSDVYSIIFASFYIGATFSPWDHELKLKTARNYMKIVQPKIIFSYENKINTILEAATLENHIFKLISLDNYESLESLNDIIKKPSNIEILDFEVESDIDPQLPSIIGFSSGTTGFPKAVAHSYDKVLKHVAVMGGINKKDDIALMYVLPAWVIHLWFLLDFIFRGITEIFHSNVDPIESCKIIERYKVNAIYIHTYYLTLICNANTDNKYNFESVNVIVPLGMKVRRKALEQIHKNFSNALISRRMGMTETGVISNFTERCKNPLSAGTARPNVQIKIVDLETGKTLGPNQPGELCVKTSTMMIGYHKNSKETALIFDDEGWLHSGDEAYFDENGELVIVGRLKDIIKYRYYDIYPADIEELLISHRKVTDAAVVPVPHPEDHERPMAFVRLAPETKVTEDELLRLTSKLGNFGLSNGFIRFIDEIPRNTNGKVNKRLLKELAQKSREICDF